MKIFYGWRMAGAASGITFMLSALLNQAFGAYVAVLSEERGWSKTALSGAAAMLSVESAVMGPLLGGLIDRFGPQSMIRIGMLVFACGFISLSLIDSLGGFYACIVTLSVGASLCGYFPLTVALIQWFEKHRARAISFMTLGSALGGLLVPLVAWSMHQFGWRATAFASGMAALVIGLPLAGMIRRRPQDHGETVDGLPAKGPADATPGGAGAPTTAPSQDFTLGQALRTKAFWLLSAGHGFALLAVTAVNVHAITHMKEALGYTVQQAALVITVVMMGQIGGVLLSAAIGDRFDKRHVAAWCMLGHATGLLLLTYGTHALVIGAFAIVHGVSWGLRGPYMQAMRADYFGRTAIGKILGISAIVVALGQIGGPMVAGVLADLTGSYRIGFTVLALVAGSGSVLFLLIRKPTLPTARQGRREP